MSTEAMDLYENDLYDGEDFGGLKGEEGAEEVEHYNYGRSSAYFGYPNSAEDLSVERTAEEAESKVERNESNHDGKARVEQLRAEYAKQLSRKTVAMKLLVMVFEKGLWKLDKLSGQDTKEEDEAHYESLLMQFKEKKEAILKKVNALKEKIDAKTQIMESKAREGEHLKNRQLDLELNTAMTIMFHENNKQPMSYQDALSITDSFARSNKALNEFQLEFISLKNQCIKLKSEIGHLKNTYDFDSYSKLVAENSKLVTHLQRQKIVMDKRKKNVQNVRKSTEEMSKEVTDLSIKNKERTEKLNQLKQDLKLFAEIKTRNREILSKRAVANQWKNYRAAHRRLRKDYNECVAKAEENKKTVAELRRKLSQGQADLDFLKTMTLDREAASENE